jgi:hypothetical protein
MIQGAVFAERVSQTEYPAGYVPGDRWGAASAAAAFIGDGLLDEEAQPVGTPRMLTGP